MGRIETDGQCKAINYCLNLKLVTNNKRVLLLRQFLSAIINIKTGNPIGYHNI